MSSRATDEYFNVDAKCQRVTYTRRTHVHARMYVMRIFNETFYDDIQEILYILLRHMRAYVSRGNVYYNSRRNNENIAI